MTTVFCIDCDQPIRLEFRPVEGEIIFCSSCGTELEIIRVDPIELAWSYRAPLDRERGQGWNSKERARTGRRKR